MKRSLQIQDELLQTAQATLEQTREIDRKAVGVPNPSATTAALPPVAGVAL